MQECERVADVLLVQLGDLELRQQQFGERHGQGFQSQATFEGDLVGHAEGPDEDVRLSTVASSK